MKNKLTFLILILLVPISILLSLKIGYAHVSLGELIQILLGNGTEQEEMIIFTFRMPRIILGALVGVGFSISGCILQSITRNPLADPGILGINAGASFVVVMFIVLQGTLSFQSMFIMPFFSLIGGVFVGVVIYVLSSDKYRGINPLKLVLNGIAIQAGINGIMMIIVLKLDSDQFDFLAVWQAGSIWNANWKEVIVILPWILLCFVLVFSLNKSLDILRLSDDTSIGLGLDVKKERKLLLFLAIASAGVSVAFAGNVGFIGLIAPHIARQLVGNRNKYLIPASALVGSILMILADTVARKLIEPAELPVGIIVTAIGAPFFLFLLIQQVVAIKKVK